MSKVLVNNLQVRESPSTSSKVVAKYNSGETINSGEALIESEGRIWLRYKASSGNQRYICAYNNDGTKYIEVPSNIPGPRKIGQSSSGGGQGKKTESGWLLTAYCHCSKCCGKSDRITASGYQLKDSDHLKICAAPSNFAFHTVINISGGWNGTVKVEDRGGAIKGKRLDIYCKSHQEALQFGKKENCTISY